MNWIILLFPVILGIADFWVLLDLALIMLFMELTQVTFVNSLGLFMRASRRRLSHHPS